jgi:hypothetical protein
MKIRVNITIDKDTHELSSQVDKNFSHYIENLILIDLKDRRITQPVEETTFVETPEEKYKRFRSKHPFRDWDTESDKREIKRLRREVENWSKWTTLNAPSVVTTQFHQIIILGIDGGFTFATNVRGHTLQIRLLSQL